MQQAHDSAFLGTIATVYDGDASTHTVHSSGIGMYYYRVRARNLVGASSWSDVQSVYVSWETEPNNLLTQANGNLSSESVVYALPDDQDDFFKVMPAEGGLIVARVEDISGEGVRLFLYRDHIGNLLASDGSAPYQVSTYGEPGDYYVRVFVDTGYSATIPYRLTTIFR